MPLQHATLLVAPPATSAARWLRAKGCRQQRRRCTAAAAARPDAQSTTNSGGASSTAELSRRQLLQTAASVGGLYAWAGRAGAAAANAAAPLEQQLEQRVTEFTLSNGLRFIVSERHAAPIVSFHTYADVGAYDEQDGLTGIAHLLEHLAFKGTERVGTRDYRQEAPLLDALDEVFYSLRDAGSPREAAKLQEQLKALQAQAADLSIANQYGSVLQQQGAVGLNANTSHDATKYFLSLPSNKMELWFALESERFQAPVFRELYSEKAVVLEERRLRVDNSPLGPFQEQLALRSMSNNYRRPVIGFEADIKRIGRREVAQFFGERYGPQNLTIAVAGDVKPEQIRRLAEKWWGGWRQPKGGLPASSCSGGSGGGAGPGGREERLARPPEGAPLQYEAASRAGPAVMQAYYRPCLHSPDGLTLDVLSDVLSGSRSSRLYRSLVTTNKALTVTSFASFPAEKHANQFIIYGIPSRASTMEQLESDMEAELAALAGEGPTQEELRRIKKATRAQLLDALTTNSSMAAALASYQALTGDWRGLLGDLERIESLTPAGVRDVAARYLVPTNCFRGYVLPLNAGAAFVGAPTP